MIIVPVKEGENIERALKKFKRKYEKTGVVKELRKRQQYNKPSVLKRLHLCAEVASERRIKKTPKNLGVWKFFRKFVA